MLDPYTHLFKAIYSPPDSAGSTVIHCGATSPYSRLGWREGAIKRLIVLGSTGMEVLDEMFICSLNGDQKVQPLSNAAAAKTIGAP